MYFHQSQTRQVLGVSYLVSFHHSASDTTLHVYQATEQRKGPVGSPAKRILIIADEEKTSLRRQAMPTQISEALVSRLDEAQQKSQLQRGEAISNTTSPYDQRIQRCISFSRIQEVNLLPDDTRPISSEVPLHDLDALLQHSTPLDFIRTVGALFRSDGTSVAADSTLGTGSPPLYQLDEGQPLAARVNCGLRKEALRTAIVDGVSRDALAVLSQEHHRQVRAVRENVTKARSEQNNEYLDLFHSKEELKKYCADLERLMSETQTRHRKEKDEVRIMVTTLQEQLRASREEVRMLKMLRHGVGTPPSTSTSLDNHLGADAADGTSSALFAAASPPYNNSQQQNTTMEHYGANDGGTRQYQMVAGVTPKTHNFLSELQRDIEEGENFLHQTRRSISQEQEGFYHQQQQRHQSINGEEREGGKYLVFGSSSPTANYYDRHADPHGEHYGLMRREKERGLSNVLPHETSNTSTQALYRREERDQARQASRGTPRSPMGATSPISADVPLWESGKAKKKRSQREGWK